MANPLKILTVLSASKAVHMNEGLTVASGDTAVQKLAVAGELTASSAVKFLAGADINNQKVTGLANATGETDAVAYVQLTSLSSSVKSYVDAADTALSGAFDTRVTALSGAASASLAAEKFAREQGDSQLTSLVNTVSQSLVADYIARDSALSSSLSSYVDARDLAVSSSLKSYVDAADTALSGAIVAEATARVAEDLTFLKLDGTRAMSGALNMGGQDITSAKSGSFSGDVTVGGNLQVNGALTYINTTNLDVTDKLVTFAKGAVNAAAANGGGIELEGAGASLTYAETGDKWVSNKSFQVAADLFISGASDFSYINVARSAGQYDVDAAIQALDVAVSGAVNAGGNFKADYNARRHVATGNLSSGQAILNLTTLGGAEFAAGEISKIALDVMIDSDSTGYTNDLVAIKMFVDGADVKVQIDAPATPSAAYRLIAVNEEDIA